MQGFKLISALGVEKFNQELEYHGRALWEPVPGTLVVTPKGTTEMFACILRKDNYAVLPTSGGRELLPVGGS
jgi:hypothetical protein